MVGKRYLFGHAHAMDERVPYDKIQSLSRQERDSVLRYTTVFVE